ncbi:MAG TPA: type II toxin-antitoxin system PemK/MazF family toxin [Mucilaginibacter sp.]|jgi:mRNA interferase MazF|nr:type II toxin-antitoxin system PemK/MazF family toxin [Mucilaginibacter sp.]
MKQNEIWLIDLEPTVGAEIRKTRPGIIVNDNTFGKLPLKVIVPLTDWKERFADADWMVKIEVDNYNHLIKTSAADCFQVRSLSQDRFKKRLGIITPAQLMLIQDALASVLCIQRN